MSEQFNIPAYVWLKPTTYRALEQLATERSTTIAVLLSHLADRALQPAKSGTYRMTPERLYRFKALYAQGKSDSEISRILGCSTTSIGYHRRKLRLPATHKQFGAS